jgi:hypothetical protein
MGRSPPSEANWSRMRLCISLPLPKTPPRRNVDKYDQDPHIAAKTCHTVICQSEASTLRSPINAIMPYSNGALLVLLVLGAVAWKITTSRRTVASAPLPPGPPADPIIGHIRVVPTDRPEVCYQKWGKEFKSDVLYLNLMGQPLIILNSAQAAIDLMDKRSSIYSDRPPLPMYEEAGWKDCIVFMSTGPQFRKHRKMFQTAFASSNTAQYRIKQESLARPLINRILQKPGDWREHLWRYGGSIVLAIAYGLQVTDDNDPWVILTKRMSHFFENGGSPGATLVDVIPLLRRLPSWVRIFPSLNYARDNFALTREFYEEPFAEVKRRIASGTPNISFVRRMLEEMESTGLNGNASDITEDDIKGAASSMYALYLLEHNSLPRIYYKLHTPYTCTWGKRLMRHCFNSKFYPF